jgi:hypothetical protein
MAKWPLEEVKPLKLPMADGQEWRLHFGTLTLLVNRAEVHGSLFFWKGETE